MQTVTLAYTFGGDSYSRSFNVWSANIVDVEFERRLVRTLAGGYIEKPVGYRYLMNVDFAPIGQLSNTLKDDLFWLYGFRLGTAKTLTFQKSFQDAGETTRSVVSVSDKIEFDFYNGVSFAAGFRMEFYETSMRTITDTGALRTLILTYEPMRDEIVSGTWYRTVDFVDECSAEIELKELKYISGNHDALCFGYKHRFRVEFGAVVDIAKQDWLIEYCLWDDKQIDTTLIDPDNGNEYTVVVEGMDLRWSFENGCRELLGASLTFTEKDLRTVPEVYIVPGAPDFILDETKLDEGVIA